MFKTTLLGVLAVATGVFAQFALEITEPSPSEFVELGQNHDITIQADVPAGTTGPNIQIALCQQISGPSNPCTLTNGTVILNAAFAPPEQTYSVLIPASQAPGVTRLIAGHISGTTVTDVTSINIFLGGR